MIRDPFNLRRGTGSFKPSLSRTSSSQPAASSSSSSQTDAHDLAMSFAIPKNVPSFGSVQRNLEDQVWGSGARSSTLPMYKDKPLGHRERKSFWKSKRVMGFLIFVVVTFLYWTGSSSKTPARRKYIVGDWSWQALSQDDKKPDWDHRRDRVVEAFELSWDAYKRYGWGTLKCCSPQVDEAN